MRHVAKSKLESISVGRIKLTSVVCLLLLTSSAVVDSKAEIEMRGIDSDTALQAKADQEAHVEIRELKQGQLIEREMAGGEAHTYRIALTAGQYLNVVVQQLGVNVEIDLSDPKGGQIANLDWWWREGTESLWALAQSTGDYMLKLSAPSKPTETGKYRIKLEKLGEWQQASAGDRDFVTAHKTFAEGKRLVAQGTADSQRKAVEKFQEILALWRILKDGDAEAQTLNEMGEVEYKLGNLKQATESISQAIPLFRASRNRRSEVGALNSLGALLNFSGETQKALETYRSALPLARGINDQFTEARILAGIGLVLRTLGQTQEALETLNGLLSLARATEDLDAEGVAHNNIGLIHVSMGRLRDAIQHYSQTLSILKSTGNRFAQAITLNNIGNAYSRMGEFQKALEFLLQALNLRRQSGDRRGEGTNLGSIGYLYLRMGDDLKARQHCESALALSRSVGDRDLESSALINLATVHAKSGELQTALDYAQQALAVTIKLGNRNGEANILTNLGSVYSRLGDRQKALENYDRALSIRRTVGDQYGESYTLSALGVVYKQLGDQKKALEFVNQSLALSRTIGDRLGEVASLYEIAKLERGRNDFTKARSQVEAALELVESTRTKVSLADVRAVYFASRQELYDFYIDLLMQLYQSEKETKSLADALRANERRSARGLLDSLTEARANIRAGVSPELLDRERSLQQDLNAKADQQVRLLSRKHTEEQADSLAKEIETLTTQYEQALAQIHLSSPRYAALTQPAPLSLKQIQSEVLDSDTLLLEYSLGEERSYLWAVTPTSIKSFELPRRAEIEAAALRVYELLVARADALHPDALTTLSQMLLKPVADQLGRKRLVIVSQGTLQYVPFGALPAPETGRRGDTGTGGRVSDRRVSASPRLRVTSTPLIVNHEIVSLPSASVLAILRRELGTRKPAPKTLAVLADPVFDKDDQRVKSRIRSQQVDEQSGIKKESDKTSPPSDVERSIKESGLNSFDRLLLSRREAELITALASKGQPFKAFDFAASRATASSPELDQYQIVHFATHSLLNNQHPELSGIVLSLVDERGQAQDGFLRLYEIFNLKLSADMVVLSACQTALGKEIKGEGLVGLTRGFMYAGVPRVVASLWKVSDKATAELMQRFYQKMLKDGMRPAAALRAAQVSMLKEKQWSAAYYWAGFVLQGEWR